MKKIEGRLKEMIMEENSSVREDIDEIVQRHVKLEKKLLNGVDFLGVEPRLFIYVGKQAKPFVVAGGRVEDVEELLSDIQSNFSRYKSLLTFVVSGVWQDRKSEEEIGEDGYKWEWQTYGTFYIRKQNKDDALAV